jgi:4-hydroxy-3-polyprenylbenzoate decarboxylase
MFSISNYKKYEVPRSAGLPDQLEQAGQLLRVAEPVSPRLEMTAVGDQRAALGGPAVLFTQPAGHGCRC